MTRMDDRTKRLAALGDGWTRLAAMAEQQDTDHLTLLERIAEGMGRPKGLRDQADTPTVDTSGRPLHSDPTGEAAMHPARNDLAAFDRACKAADDALGVALGIAERHQVREANTRDMADASKANGNPGCTACAQVDRWEQVKANGLCGWCEQFRRRNGVDPTSAQVRAHHAGERVMVKAT